MSVFGRLWGCGRLNQPMATQGTDAATKIVGCERSVAADFLGLPLAVCTEQSTVQCGTGWNAYLVGAWEESRRLCESSAMFRSLCGFTGR